MIANNPRLAQASAEANTARAAQAGREQAQRARRAVAILQQEGPHKAHVQRWMHALQHRIDHPEATLAELGASMTPPMTKHAYGALLRRALQRYR